MATSTTKAQYMPPKVGILGLLPESLVPFGELMRLGKPTGTVNFAAPFFFGAAYASWIQRTPLPIFVYKSLALVVAAFFLRSAGCAWNDIIDKEADKLVERCRLRPMARGAVTDTTAILFTAALTLIACVILGDILPATTLAVYSVPYTILMILYPYGKKFTDHPQLILGLWLSTAVFIGSAALGFDILSYGEIWQARVLGIVGAALAYCIWCIIHDTIYGYQDYKDDKKAGLKSMSVRYRPIIMPLLASLGVMEVGLQAGAGIAVDAGTLYHVFASIGSAAVIAAMLMRVNLNDPASCLWWFQTGCQTICGTIAIGMFLEYLQRLS